MVPYASRTGEQLEAWAKGFITRGSGQGPCGVRFRYGADDPFVVTMTVTPQTGPAFRWHVSRDLLTSGLGAAVGIGAVAVLPGRDEGEPPHVTIRVRERRGETRLRMGHAVLMTYLERSHALQPFGTEPTEVALDRELARILGEEPA